MPILRHVCTLCRSSRGFSSRAIPQGTVFEVLYRYEVLARPKSSRRLGISLCSRLTPFPTPLFLPPTFLPFFPLRLSHFLTSMFSYFINATQFFPSRLQVGWAHSSFGVCLLTSTLTVFCFQAIVRSYCSPLLKPGSASFSPRKIYYFLTVIFLSANQAR